MCLSRTAVSTKKSAVPFTKQLSPRAEMTAGSPRAQPARRRPPPAVWRRPSPHDAAHPHLASGEARSFPAFASNASSPAHSHEDLSSLDDDQGASSSSRVRSSEFALIYVAYMCFLLARKNYGFWLPSVLSELQAGKGEAGLLGSTFEIVYGTCALLNGVLIDMASPKHLLICGLLASAAVNVCISSTSALPLMVFLWGTNGFVQSFGWPSVTNVFLSWFPDPASRGAWYSLLSTCQNAGAALVPLLVSAFVARYSWRAALYVPAAVAIAVAALLGVCMYGSPAAYASGGGARRANASPPKLPRGLGRMLKQQVLLNRALWLMALNYFCISLLRTSLSDWSTVFLREAKGLSMQTAARCLFMLETGGFAGSLAAGWLSDNLFAGRRGPVVALCSAAIAPALLCMLRAEGPLLLQACYAWLGFCAFPVHVLLGLFSREVVAPHVSSSAGGFVKCIAQVGGAFAGYPLGRMQQIAGWNGVFMLLAAIAVLSATAALPLWSTTAQEAPLRCRQGTVADFNEIQGAVSKDVPANRTEVPAVAQSPQRRGRSKAD